MTHDVAALLSPIRRIHEHIRDEVVRACEQAVDGESAGVRVPDLASVAADGDGDTIYAIDRVSERQLIGGFTELAETQSLVLVAEGISDGSVVLPRGTSASEAAWRIIVDPIDGTRGLMYQKRSAWILTGVARNRGPDTDLQDIELAVQTEIPRIKQHLSDTVWAIRGHGASAERFNRLSGERTPLRLRPSQARTIEHGFATLARFVPGARAELAAIDDEIACAALGPIRPGKAQCFEDQYISTGGQLYELMAGHDRFIADIRPLMEPILARQGTSLGICCHPYDICTELIARELGVAITDARGRRLRAPLTLDADVHWVGYANAALRARLEPLLQAALSKRGL